MEDQLTFIQSSNIVTQEESFVHHGKPRLNLPVRNQIAFAIGSLDDLIPQDHAVRFVWSYVEQLDMSNILGTIQSVEGKVGRPATDPKILLALWLYATLEGIISARVIADFCEEHIAYKWLCGGVRTNHHTISDFAIKYGKQFDDFLTQSVAILMKEGFVDLEEIAQDGMRVRASAGESSFKQEEKLMECYAKAKDYLNTLRKEMEKNNSANRSKKEAATLRAAQEREKRVKQALEELKKLKEEKGKNKYTKPEKIAGTKVSITDMEARIMKMPSGGYHPAYNVQFATARKGLVIVGVDVNNQGNDKGLIKAMINQIHKRYGVTPLRWLADGGFRDRDDITRAVDAFQECKIYIPSKKGKIPFYPKCKETPAVIEWRERMETQEGKEIYKRRSATAEFSNAQTCNKGIKNLIIRGLIKIKIAACKFALTHNMQRYFNMKIATL